MQGAGASSFGLSGVVASIFLLHHCWLLLIGIRLAVPMLLCSVIAGLIVIAVVLKWRFPTIRGTFLEVAGIRTTVH